MQNENTLMILGDSPIEAVATEKVKAMAERVRTLVQDGQKLSGAQALTIAQLSILTRTLPGRDVHYFLDKSGNLKMSDDYKFLRAWAVRREQFVTGDQAATFEDTYAELDDTQKMSEGIAPNDFAVFCTLTTKRERDNFRREVKGWIDLGFTPDEAVKTARSILGTIGTRAVGVVNANDGLTNSNGETNRVPKGWSLMQKARKLAFKNAVHAKWGQPSVDDLQQMVKSMARGDVIDADWEAVPADVTAEEQSRYAEGNAIARRVKAESESLTTDQRQERKAANAELMRGSGDDAIGESDKERFARRVMSEVPFYASQSQVFMTLMQLGLDFNPDTEELCFDELAKEANRQADKQAA
jgi:hypothetical protein